MGARDELKAWVVAHIPEEQRPELSKLIAAFVAERLLIDRPVDKVTEMRKRLQRTLSKHDDPFGDKT